MKLNPLSLIDLSVTDLGSANGTFLNRKVLEPHKKVSLKDGDFLHFGFSTLKFLVKEVAVGPEVEEPKEPSVDDLLEAVAQLTLTPKESVAETQPPKPRTEVKKLIVVPDTKCWLNLDNLVAPLKKSSHVVLTIISDSGKNCFVCFLILS